MKEPNKLLFERDGYFVVRGLYTAAEMQDWKRRILAQMAARGWTGDPSGVTVWKVEELDAFFCAQLTDRRIGSILVDLMGPAVEFLSVKPVFKNNTVTFGSPWHHDWAYWKGSRKVSIWIALDEATPTNGCLKMVPGSHKKYVEMDVQAGGAGFGHRIDESAVAGLPVAAVPAAPGDAVVFHDLTLHSSFPNTDGLDRWSFIATYRDGAVPDASTVWASALPVHTP